MKGDFIYKADHFKPSKKQKTRVFSKKYNSGTYVINYLSKVQAQTEVSSIIKILFFPSENNFFVNFLKVLI